MNYERFVRKRITELRLGKNVSEYQMSYDLDKSRGYIYNISSGKALPPLRELFKMIDYFGITPAEFFDDKSDCPDLIQQAIDGMNGLTPEDMEVVLAVIGQLCVMREAIEDLTKTDNDETKPMKTADFGFENV